MRVVSEKQREAARLRALAWRLANTERHRAYTRAYWAARRGHKNDKNREWNKENPDRAKAHQAAYRERNREKCNTASRNWRERNPAERKAACQRYRARLRGAAGGHTGAEWEKLKRRFGNRCLCCGDTGSKLTPDHVIPLCKGGANDISNIQPLCGLCNSRKGVKETDYRRDFD